MLDVRLRLITEYIYDLDTSNLCNGTIIYESSSNTFYIYANGVFYDIKNESNEEKLPFDLR